MNSIAKKQPGIYAIKDAVGDCFYVGKTSISMHNRWLHHVSLLRRGIHFNRNLQTAWNEHGEENFSLEILEVVNDISSLDALEKEYVAKFKNNHMCFNLYDGGHSHLTEEAKRMIGDKNRKHMTGKKRSEETRKRMSSSQLKRYAEWSEEDRLAFRRIVSEKSRGYRWNDDARRMFAETQKTKPNGAKFTADQIREIRTRSAEGKSDSELAVAFGTTKAYIRSIILRKRWANI